MVSALEICVSEIHFRKNEWINECYSLIGCHIALKEGNLKMYMKQVELKPVASNTGCTLDLLENL